MLEPDRGRAARKDEGEPAEGYQHGEDDAPPKAPEARPQRRFDVCHGFSSREVCHCRSSLDR